MVNEVLAEKPGIQQKVGKVNCGTDPKKKKKTQNCGKGSHGTSLPMPTQTLRQRPHKLQWTKRKLNLSRIVDFSKYACVSLPVTVSGYTPSISESSSPVPILPVLEVMSPILGVSASVDGELFVSVAEDRSAKVFDVANFAPFGPLYLFPTWTSPTLYVTPTHHQLQTSSSFKTTAIRLLECFLQDTPHPPASTRAGSASPISSRRVNHTRLPLSLMLSFLQLALNTLINLLPSPLLPATCPEKEETHAPPTHDFPLAHRLNFHFPNCDIAGAVLAKVGTAPFSFVSINDAIGDLPCFDWKNLSLSRLSTQKRAEALCGTRQEPSMEEIAQILLANPRQFYELANGCENHLFELRNLAVNKWLLGKSTVIRMKWSNILLGSWRVKRSGARSSNEGDEDHHAPRTLFHVSCSTTA
ncbi:hypothetical protein H4582DRAFT_2064337 [Lactarius indigo]|nr:hypothetical protein H4582DRAFT_2064337 [Lactarius indigo]